MSDFVTILGDDMPRDMYNYLADMISPTLRGYKYTCAPEDFECPICHEKNELPIVQTECDHMYHLDCLENWETIRNDCPVCRNVLPGCEKTLVEELLLRTKEYMKMCILKGWWDKLEGLSQEEIGVVKEQMQAFVDRDGGNPE